jgi:SAM-dependent methyltransferase
VGEADRARLGALMDVRPAQTIAVLNHLGIADLLADGPVGVDQLAAATASHELTLYRLLRYAASYGVFTEVAPQRFGLTPMAEHLRAGVPGSAYWRVEPGKRVPPWWPWDEWLETVRTGVAAFERVHGCTYWEAMASDEGSRHMFDLSLRAIAGRQIPEVLPLLDLDGRRVVVDVGCGPGPWLAAILEQHPHLHGVAFDLEEARASAEATLSAAGLGGRATFVAGDFFAEVPGGDLLLLANVLHDWHDEDAARILDSCRAALEPGGRIVIVDRVLPDGDEPHHGKGVDLNMLFNVGGRERSLGELTSLLAAAGLTLVAHQDTALAVSVVVAAL